MAQQRFDDCIYCGAPNGSGEHLVQAALAGLRTDNRILCGSCNSKFSPIDEKLADDLRPLNALIGAQHGRTKDHFETPVEDPVTGLNFVLSKGKRLLQEEAFVLQDETSDGVRKLYATASTQHQADEFVGMLKAQGKKLDVTRETVPQLFAHTPVAMWGFGGPDTFRAIAKSVVNLLAHQYPIRAREVWLEPLKRFIREGGDSDRWVHYAFSDERDSREPPDSFVFQHRFLIGFDALSGVVYAKVSFLGVVELSVQLGVAQHERSETLVYDMDVLAQRMPGDIKIQKIEGEAICGPGAPTKDPRAVVSRRLVLFNRKRDDLLWREEAPGLVQSLNAVRDAPPAEQHDLIVDALAKQLQRLLNQAARFVSTIGRHLAETNGAQGLALGEAFRLFVQGDSTNKTGVTELAYMNTEMLRFVMADHLGKILSERPIDEAELRSLLEGQPGLVIVGEYLVEEVEKRHPWFQDQSKPR
jgi:hypothetical protein